MKLFKHGAAVCALALGLAACVTRGEIEEIKKNQEKILSKLDAIQKGGGGGMGQARPQPPRGPDPSKVYAFSVDDSPVKGPTDAWITIVEVSEFECPFCKRVTPTLKQIQDKYGSDVRFVFKHNPLPFHRRALPSAMAAECAREQGKFWEMHDKLFNGQPALEDANIETYAKESGADVNRLKKCVADNKYKGRIDSDMQKAATMGARGTPAFFINGRFLSGAQPFESFQALIDEELKKAKDSGISKRDYYTKVVVEKGEKAAM